MFSGGWRTVRPIVSIIAPAFGRFLLASWCCIHFLGFAGRDLDVFMGMADITSSGKLFLGGFWTFLTSFLVLHPLSWLRGAGFGCFKGEWRTLRPMASFIAAAFGCFLLASWCCIHFLGFAGRDLDVFMGMADITSSGKLFLGGFWTFLTSFLVLHPLSWLRGAGFGCFKGEWRTLRPMASFIAAAFGCFLLASWCYNHFLGFAERDLDVFRRMADITSSDRYFRYGFWTFFASLWVLHPLS